jgi:hypothetical protein
MVGPGARCFKQPVLASQVPSRSSKGLKGKGLRVDTEVANGIRNGNGLDGGAKEFLPTVKTEEDIERKGEEKTEKDVTTFADGKENWDCGICGPECFCEGLPE